MRRSRFADPRVVEAFLHQTRIPFLGEVAEALLPLEDRGIVLNWLQFDWTEGVGVAHPTLTVRLAYRPEAFALWTQRICAEAGVTVVPEDGHGGV